MATDVKRERARAMRRDVLVQILALKVADQVEVLAAQVAAIHLAGVPTQEAELLALDAVVAAADWVAAAGGVPDLVRERARAVNLVQLAAEVRAQEPQEASQEPG